MLLSSSAIAATQTVNFDIDTNIFSTYSLPNGEFTLSIEHTFATDTSSTNAVNGAGFFLFYDSNFIEFVDGDASIDPILPLQGGVTETGSTVDNSDDTDSYVRVAWTIDDDDGDLITSPTDTLLASLRFRWIGATVTSEQTVMALRFNDNTLSAGRGFTVGAGDDLIVSNRPEVTDRLIIVNSPRNTVYGAATQNIIVQGGVSPTGAITFVSSTPSVASFGNTNIGALTILGVGTTIITAIRDSTSEQTSITFIVNPRTITPTFASSQTFIYNTSIRTVLATITSGIVGTDDVSLIISDTTTATDVGNYNIDLELTGVDSPNYRLSTTTLSWSIIKADQIGFTIVVSSLLEAGATTIATASGGQSTGTISFSSSNPTIATASQDGVISAQSPGTTTIIATRAGNSNYNDISANVLLEVVADTTPEAFSFIALTNVTPNTLITSNIVTISGFDSTVSIRIEGGSYTIGASAPTAAEGIVTAGVTVTAQVLSSSEFNTQTVATLTVGFGDSAIRAIFSVTTRPPPSTPSFTSTPITSARFNSLYQYILRANDADNDNLVFSAASGTELPSWLTIDTVVTTIAGGASTTARFQEPRGIAVDASANIIVADSNNHRIRRISPDGSVSTIAGNGTQDFADGASATAMFAFPTGVAIDASGNIIVADQRNHSIRRISADGTVTTIAGTVSIGSTNGASATARFNSPEAIVIDVSGDIIVADSGNHRIRSITPDGIVTTIAGSSVGFDDGASDTAMFFSPRGVVIDALGNIIVADSVNHRIRSITPDGIVRTIAGSKTGFADGASITARFNTPFGVAIDALGNIIVADSDNHRVRSITLGRTVNTIAGTGTVGVGNGDFADGTVSTARFNSLTGIAIDTSGDIIIADNLNHRIRKIYRNNLVGTPRSCDDIGIHNLELIVSDGELIDLQSFDIIVANDGSCPATPTNLALSTTTIVENILTNSIIATISADDSDNPGSLTFSIVGGADSASFSISSGNQLVIDHSPDFETQNSYEIIIAVSDTIHQLTKIFNISVNNINEFVPIFISVPITTARVNSLYQYDLNASDADGVNLEFSAALGATLPSWLAIDAVVTTLAGDGVSDNDDGASATARFSNPSGVAIDAIGNTIVADTINHRIRNISPEGIVRTIAGSDLGFIDGASATAQFIFPSGVAIDALGDIIVADTGSNRIRRISTGDVVSTIAGGQSGFFIDGASATARFNAPVAVVVDVLGNIIVADRDNHRIRSISTSGTVTTIAGSETGFADGASTTARFSDPSGVAIDALGNIIVADRDNHRIRSIAPDGIVRTIAGSETGFVDGASPTARFSAPSGVAIDTLGNIIVADRDNHRIRKITPDGVVTTIAGSSDGFTDGTSTMARFSEPSGVAIDVIGNIIVADRGNERIRKISRNSLVGTSSCGDIGIYDLELIVSDGEFEDLQSFTINVVGDGSCLIVPFSFDAIGDVALSATVTSDAIIVATNTQDLQSTFTISIEGSNARYSINGGSYTDASGVVSVGDNVRVQIVASNQLNTAKIATVSIHNIAAAFTITTTNLIIVGGDSTVSYNNLPITIDATSNDSQTIPITWTSSATSVVSFDDPNIGLITIVGVGTSLITARRGDDESSIIFTVEPLTLTPTFASPQSFIYNTNTRTVVATITSGIVSTDDIGLTISGVTTATDVGNYNIDLVLIGAASRNYRLSATTLSWSIIKADQSQFSLGADTTITFGASFSRPAAGVSATVASSYGSSNPSVATVATNGDITTIGIGSAIISATNTGDNNYNSAAASYQLVITQAPQDPFSITASDTLIFGATSVVVIVESGSGDGVISYDSSNIAVITITADGIITAAGVGEAIITATKDGGRNYLNISATHSIMVERAEQADFVISGSSTLANAATGFATATGGSGTGAIVFSSSNPDIATITQDGMINAQSLGTTTISATKSGGDNYHDISDNYLLTITNTTPTVTNLIPNQIVSLGNLFTLPIPANTFNDVNGDTLTISVSTLPDGLMFDSTNTSITGVPATVGVSDITVTADDGNGAMVSTSFSLTVSGDFIIVGSNLRNVVYGAASQNIIAQGGLSPTGTITFSSSTPSIANFGDANIGVLAILGAGTAIITATRDGTGEQASVSFIVNPRIITPTFASSSTFIYNTNIRTVLATITSGIVGTDDVSLSISGTATATDVGNYNIDLVLIGAASRNYRLSTTTLSWSIIKADQSAFSLGADTTIIFGESLSRPATGVSATVVSSYGSSDPDVATVATNGDITITGVGSTIISTTNTGDNNYNSAADSYTLNVAPLTLTIAIGSTTTIYSGAAITVTTTITNLVSGHEQVSLTINGDQTATNAGDYSFDISAIEGSDSPNYILIPITINWVVASAQQSELDITGNATRLMVGQTTTATATNDQLQGTLTISASEAGIATIEGSTITATNVGITTITITKQVANHNNISASYQLLVIQNTTAAIDAGDDRTATYVPSGVLSAQAPTNTQGRVISYAADPIASDVATININTGAITITNAGTVNIIVSAAATTNYAASTDSYLLTINQAAQEPFTITASDTLIFGATSAIVIVNLGSGDGTITYSSSDIAIATITTDGIITATGAGEATITATRDGGRNYLDTSATHLLVVERADQVVSIIGGTLSIDYAPDSATAVGRIATARTTITYSSSDEDVAIVSATSGIITIVNVGTISIVASATRTSGYNSAVASYQLIIRQVAQGPFSITASDTLIFGATSAVVIVEPGSGDGVVSYDSSDIAIITITADGIITATGVGAAIITATKDGGKNYFNTSATHSIMVERADQADFVISGSSTLANAATSFATTTGGSGTGAISFRSSNPDVATITQDGIISAQSLGTTTISATKSGGDNYRDIGDSYLLTIVNTTPTVTNPITNQTAPLRNPFIFTIPANTFNDANGDTLTISAFNLPDGLMFDSANTSIIGTPATVGISTITITADDGNGAMVSTSFSLIISDDFIIIGNNPRTIIYGVASQNIIAQGGVSPTGAITFVSSTPSVASFGDTNIGTLTISSAGTAIITATREGSGEQASISLIVSPRTITPTFASSQTFIYNTSTRIVLVTITSGIIEGDDISFTISGATAATNVGDYNIGLALIGASSPNYRLSTTTLSWSIIKADQTGFTIMVDNILEIGATITATTRGGQSSGAVSFSSSNPDVATINQDGLINTQSLGTTTLTATKAGDSNYNNTSDSTTLIVVARFNLDIDDDGSRLTTTDGILIIRFLTGPTNTINTTDATTTEAQRDNQQILKFLQRGYNRLDIDGNGTIAASSDGMIIMRYLADQENLNTTGIPAGADVGTIILNLQNIYK